MAEQLWCWNYRSLINLTINISEWPSNLTKSNLAMKELSMYCLTGLAVATAEEILFETFKHDL